MLNTAVKIFVTTHHSHRGIYLCKTLDWVRVDGHPLGRSTSNHDRQVAIIVKTEVQTISRATCLAVSFLHICAEWILSRSRVSLHHRPLFPENREKHNHRDWRTQSRRRCSARLAGFMFRGNRREVPLLLTFTDGLSLTWSVVRSYSQTKSLDHVPPPCQCPGKQWGSQSFHKRVARLTFFLRSLFL